MAWYLVFQLFMHSHIVEPKTVIYIKMPSQAVCNQIMSLNTPGPNGVPGPACWPLNLNNPKN